MMKYFIVFFIFSSLSIQVHAQDSVRNTNFTLKLLKEKDIKTAQINVDAVGFVYLIQNKNRILKLNPNLDSIGVYNNTKRYGNITYLDVDNPLRNIVYFQKFNSLYLLDRFLNTTANINLRSIQINPPIWICSSIDNDIWLYSNSQAKLFKINNKGQQVLETIDLRLLKVSLPNPSWMYDNGKNILLYDSTVGFYIFNRYGNFEKIIPIKNLKFLHYYQDNIWGIADNKLVAISHQYQTTTQQLPAVFENISFIKRFRNNVYIVQSNVLKIYEVN